MSIELYEEFERSTLEIGIVKERFDEISSYILEDAIEQVRKIPNYYSNLKSNTIAIGIEIGMDEKCAESMAESFVNNKRIKETMESSIVDKTSRIWFWFHDEARSYATNFARGQRQASERVAKNILQIQYPIELISEYTDLSEQEIEKLKHDASLTE